MVYVAKGTLAELECHKDPEDVHKRFLEVLDTNQLLHSFVRLLVQSEFAERILKQI